MKRRKVFITGSSGFVGQYLINHLNDHLMDVVLLPDIVDIRNKNDMIRFCSNNSFDYVIHLASQSFVPRSIINPRETYDINFMGTLNLLEALSHSNFGGTFLFISSSDVYGIVSEDQLPIKECNTISPRSPYAASKAATELLCKQWGTSEKDIRILISRSFNHIGPLQDERFVISSFCKQVAMIKCGLQKPLINVGNLKVTRDFTDVRDVVSAYRLLLEEGVHGRTYNVCSGQEILLESVLPELRHLANIDFDANLTSPKELISFIDNIAGGEMYKASKIKE